MTCQRALKQLFIAAIPLLAMLLSAIASAQIGEVNHDELEKLRRERDSLLKSANLAASRGNPAEAEKMIVQTRVLNRQATALRQELIEQDLKSKQNFWEKKIGALNQYQSSFHDPFLLIVPPHDPEGRKLERYLPIANKVLYDKIGCRNLPARVTVIFAGTDDQRFRKLCRLAAEKQEVPEAMSWQDCDNTILAPIKDSPGIMLAGMTTALVKGDFEHAPLWLKAMLATLNETSKFLIDREKNKSDVEYLFNGRFELLQQAESIPPISGIIALNQFDSNEKSRQLQLAQLRQFGLWLEHQGWLTELYSTFRDYREIDPLGIRQLEKISGKSWQQLQKQYQAWLERQINAAK